MQQTPFSRFALRRHLGYTHQLIITRSRGPISWDANIQVLVVRVATSSPFLSRLGSGLVVLVDISCGRSQSLSHCLRWMSKSFGMRSTRVSCLRVETNRRPVSMGWLVGSRRRESKGFAEPRLRPAAMGPLTRDVTEHQAITGFRRVLPSTRSRKGIRCIMAVNTEGSDYGVPGELDVGKPESGSDRIRVERKTPSESHDNVDIGPVNALARSRPNAEW